MRYAQVAAARRERAVRALIAVAIAAGVGLLLLIGWLAWRLLLLAFAGVLLAVLMRGAADWLRRHTGVGEGPALAAVLLLLAVLVVGGAALVGTQIAQQTGQLIEAVSGAAQQGREQLASSEWGRWMLRQAREGGAPISPGEVLVRLTGYAGTALGALVDALVVLFVALYLAINPRQYLDGAVRLVPPRGRPRARRLFADIASTIRAWLLGRLLAMVLVGIVIFAGLWLLDVRLALALALLAFLLEIIPNIGPVIAAIPALLVAAPDGLTQTALVAGLYLVVQNLEGYVLTPLIQQRTVELPPALTILFLVLLGTQAGALGALVAAPLLAVLIVVVRELYLKEE